MKALVCILSQTRAWELTYDSFFRHLYRDNMDVCLAIGVDETYNHQNPYCTLAKYKFLFKEPEDYGTAFDFAMDTMGYNSNWRILLKIPFDWLGGIKGDNQQLGSAAIGFFYKWWLIYNLRLFNLIKEYDWFIITRSDNFYEFDHPSIENLNPENIYIPQGEDYRGITDRHMIVHRDFVEKSVEILSDIITDPEKLYQEMIAEGLDKGIGYEYCNAERYLNFILKKRSLTNRVIRFPRMMYLVRGEADGTRWFQGAYIKDAGMIVKYFSEYQMVINNKNSQQAPKSL